MYSIHSGPTGERNRSVSRSRTISKATGMSVLSNTRTIMAEPAAYCVPRPRLKEWASRGSAVAQMPFLGNSPTWRIFSARLADVPCQRTSALPPNSAYRRLGGQPCIAAQRLRSGLPTRLRAE